MDETRVNRYKEYRQSFIKEGSIPLETPVETQPIDKVTTSTLPRDEVLQAVKVEEVNDNSIARRRVILIIVEIIISVAVVAGLVVLGIFAWGNL